MNKKKERAAHIPIHIPIKHKLVGGRGIKLRGQILHTFLPSRGIDATGAHNTSLHFDYSQLGYAPLGCPAVYYIPHTANSPRTYDRIQSIYNQSITRTYNHTQSIYNHTQSITRTYNPCTRTPGPARCAGVKESQDGGL